MPDYYQRTFNRYETKYLVSVSRIPTLTEALEPYTRRDPNVSDRLGYPVYSVYWDSSGHACFWEKIEGLKDRRKLRFRAYEPGGEVYVEIKERDDRTIRKRRVRWPVERAVETFGWNGDSPRWGGELADDPVASEALHLRYTYRMRPMMAVRYRRLAFFGRFEPGLRITFDTRVQYSATHLLPDRAFDRGKYLVDPRLAVLEVKFDERVPRWLLRILATRELGLNLIRLSKYCRAVDLEHYTGELT